ncbi:probable LRR receptor-like serine/threonine-protein kinase At3g47570 [Prosopis cineraria]|uniref:probable LRR receptor-like serine/threonine-protein kinase At3g47570 n=1 Tax=Prosopis cineraria TaxID=364024 RepID=UPI00240F72BA|nr:probable LRR receptor-like serine/threonine-protein kinase At3g47570 [Prosopis cineraria]XP_054813991.1 probable LRR receptor-like serine/threonine-protein kinase At3g47570 [Prosopis cineraria]
MMDGSCNKNIVVLGFLWLLTLSNVDLCICSASSQAQCLPSEREALLKLNHRLSDTSNRLASWSPHEINCCNWEFVVCSNITGHILELHLTTPSELYETSKFGGELHSSVLDLKDLNYLDLSGNDFGYMQIPTFLGSMASLTHLNLSHVRFSGSIPLHLWNLSNLIYLDLGGNHFEGNIPHQIGSLFNLIYLDLGNNYDLNGSIPHQIGNLSNLLHLGLRYNDFSGSIPQEIGNLSNLNYLQLQGSLQSSMDRDVFSTSIENLHWLSTLSSLQYLELIHVNLSNTFDWLQVLDSLPTLRELHLSGCDFNNHFQPSNSNFSSLIVLSISGWYFGSSLIPKWIFQLKNLVHLQLYDNGFPGSIPNGIQNLTLLQHLDLSQNRFNTSIPDWLYSFSHLKSLILFYNYLVSTISSNIGNLTSLVTLDLSDNLLEELIPILMGNLCNLKTLSFSSNKLNQQISKILKILSGCASQALEIFYMAGARLSGHLTNQIDLFKNLIELDLSFNSIQCPIHGSLGNLASLKYLNLGNNSIKGELPSSLGNLTSLICLSLHDNAIHGAFPSWLGNLTSLMLLDLTNNQLDGNPFEILGSLSKLNGLYLGQNLFQGVIKEAHLVNFTQL